MAICILRDTCAKMQLAVETDARIQQASLAFLKTRSGAANSMSYACKTMICRLRPSHHDADIHFHSCPSKHAFSRSSQVGRGQLHKTLSH